MSTDVDEMDERKSPPEGSFAYRLKRACELRNVKYSPQSIANRINAAHPKAPKMDRRVPDGWIIGRNGPDGKTMFVVADAFKVDARWLALGGSEEDMLPKPAADLTPDELELLRGYREAHAPLKAAMSYIAFLATESGQEFATKVTREKAPNEKILAAFGIPTPRSGPLR